MRTTRFLVLGALFVASSLHAQTPRTARLLVTVADQTGAVIPGATVTLAGLEDATKAAAVAPGTTSPQGIAAVDELMPGRYMIQADFAGFEPGVLKDVRVRPGDNKQVVVLRIKGLETAVTVQQDAADTRASFGSTLTREQLEALSDDPAELRRQLEDMAGPGAVITVDSFEGGALPLKAQIRSIRISRDQFAAEYHSAGGVSVEIITQPGIGPIRVFTGVSLRDGSTSARSPFTPRKGPEQLRTYNLGLGGTLISQKSSFNLFTYGQSSYDTPNINIVGPQGNRSEALRLRSPRDNIYLSGQVDYALTLDQTLRFGYTMNRSNDRNLGIGAYDEEERGFARESGNHTIRMQHMGPVGRRMFVRSRLQVYWTDSESRAAVEAPTIRVNDAFTSGGAQVSGGEHNRSVNFAGDFDYVRGIHTFRTGLAVDASSIRSDDASNYLGTYTFESLDEFLAGRPRSYTRRIGDPNVSYRNFQGAVYVQDDIRVRRNLTLSPGVRYEAQTHLSDYNNVAPRFGITWSPFRSGRTTLRSSLGIFYDWMPMNTYEQTLRVDGLRQRELNVINPGYPELFDIGVVPPTNRYLLGSDIRTARLTRASAGIDQQLFRGFRSSVTYSHTRSSGLLRGLNRNAPVDGVRPDPVFGNIVESVADGRARQHQVQLNITVNPGALLPAFNERRIRFSRSTVFVNYTFGEEKNNADGPFSIPATGNLDEEWGLAGGDVRHRLNFSYNNQIIRNLQVSTNVNGVGGAAYGIRTGRDENGDLIFNDRPAGVGRNTLRTTAQWTLNTYVAYTFVFGRQVGSLPPGVTVIGGGGTAAVRTFDQGGGRYRLSIGVFGQNLTNRPNYIGYSGTMTSQHFRQATAVTGMRKIQTYVGLNF
jgi:hypothetical protein